MADTTKPQSTPVIGQSLRDRQTIVDALAAFPEELSRTLDGQPDEALLRPASDGGWGVIENLCHLRDWEEIYLNRVRVIIDQERPALPAYDDELWAVERDYRGQKPMKALAQFNELRTRLLEVLGPLPDEAWQRRATHAVHGEVTLRWIVNHICDHDDEHLLLIRDALA